MEFGETRAYCGDPKLLSVGRRQRGIVRALSMLLIERGYLEMPYGQSGRAHENALRNLLVACPTPLPDEYI
ncbi:hypothetical protein SSPO_001160 [Streptomyces antimycoticus]|uniref:Uncharacterized protein n=1 Tax=Streptomyces antimycoticus TaxID=68175 RepID=A0A499UDR7_9ACTN|nr:hypothetical protein SSPO_001160 [Streptomyces antimycoticus]